MFIKNSTSDFKILCNSLKFEKDFSKATYLVNEHLKLVHHKLNTFCSYHLNDPDLSSALKHLPQTSYLRLISSPYLCELLMILENHENKDFLLIRNQIIAALVAEVKLINPNYKHALHPTWTIDGDFVFNARIAEMAPPVRTTCGININYQSAIHNTGKPGIGGYDHKTALKHKERIETAKNLIAQTSLPALSMVEAFTTIIQVRQNTLRPNVINSSTHTSIGLVRCDNFHKIHTDLAEVVDMLVHESIHQYLHLFEEQVFDFIKKDLFPEELKEARIYASPWSGKMLDFRSYTHAILVWYGLVSFWIQFLSKKIEHPEISARQAKEKLDESLYGFVNSTTVLDNFKNDKIYLSEDYIVQINRIQTEVKTMIESGYAHTLL